jgi:iron complex transport system permease protein
MRAKSKFQIIGLALLFLLAVNVVFGLSFGSVSIPFEEILAIFQGEQTENWRILLQIRLPRVVGALLVGIFLALSGAILQAILHNPIAESGILGISAGASLAAVIIMILFPFHSQLVVPLSFLGGLMTFVVIALLTYRTGLQPIQVILSGIAISAIWGGLQAILLTAYSDRLGGVIHWLNGALNNLVWEDVRNLFFLGMPAVILLLFLAPKLNLVLLGDDVMHNLGVPITLYRLAFSLLAVYFTAISVAYTGVIGFVGLIVPHIGRLIVGNNQKVLLPMTILLGANLLLLADTVSRVIVAPQEIPVGTVMSLLGGPFFLYLLLRTRKN